ncbi:hypothetical protein AOLI_G00020160 [Acnodon oligacanthus]
MEIQSSPVSWRSSAGADMEAIEQTLKCPVCMDFFTDPVLLPCGHNFCRTCIRTVWNMDGSGEDLAGPLFCPECQIFLPPDLKLESNMELRQKAQCASACGDGKEESPLRSSPSAVMCDHCIERRSVAVKSCLSCDASLCSAHTHHHLQKEVLRGHTLIEVTENLLSYKCGEHSEELKLFCQDDQTPVCSLCVVVGPHKGHQVVRLQKACSDFKKVLQEREGQLLERRHVVERAVQDLQPLFSKASCTAEAYKVRIAEKYSQIKTLIEKDEQLMMDVLETEEFYTSKWLESKKESLECHIRDIDTLLSTSKSLFQENNDLKFLQQLKMHRLGERWELGPLSLEKECTTSYRMETVERLADSLYESVFQNTRRLWANLRAIHLDAESAHPKLEVSSDMLEVCWSKQNNQETEDTSNSNKQTQSEYSVLARETFSSGCHYWEVAVWEKPYWLIGVSYRSDTEAAEKTANPSCSFLNHAFCYIYHGNGKYLACNGSEEMVFSVGKKIHKLGVRVDFQRHILSFYDGDTLKLLHSFTVEFLGPVKPIFNPCVTLNEQNMQPLVLFNIRGQK